MIESLLMRLLHLGPPNEKHRLYLNRCLLPKRNQKNWNSGRWIEPKSPVSFDVTKEWSRACNLAMIRLAKVRPTTGSLCKNSVSTELKRNWCSRVLIYNKKGNFWLVYLLWDDKRLEKRDRIKMSWKKCLDRSQISSGKVLCPFGYRLGNIE